jgi:hypothetical protein
MTLTLVGAAMVAMTDGATTVALTAPCAPQTSRDGVQPKA